MPHRVAFLGFSEFERKALASYFRLTHNRSPAYEQVPTLTDADFLVADADHGPSVQLVQAIERMGETVFIGNLAPEGARAWRKRPIDALHVMRELDRLVAHALGARAPRDDHAGPQTTIIQQARQRLRAPAARPDPSGNALLGDLPFSARGLSRELAPELARELARELAPELARQAARDPAPESAFESAAAAEPDPLILRDPQPGRVPAAPCSPPPEKGLVANEPALPVTRPLVAEAEWLPKPPPVAPAAPLPPVAGVMGAAAITATKAATAGTATTAPREASRQAPMPTKAPVQRVSLMPAKPRVLLVDDSAIALRFLEVRLGGWQLAVDRAATSQAAVALLAKHSYDIVFLDIELGQASELDGLTLCQRIKHSPALLGALVILISAHHSELDRVRGALAGCDAYLAKPLDMQELQRLMDRQGVLAVSSEGAAAP